MRQIVAILLTAGMVQLGIPWSALAGSTASSETAATFEWQLPGQCATVDGVVRGADGSVLPNATARIRAVDTGQVVDSVQSDAGGKFLFGNVGPGTYVIEILDAQGNIIGTSPTIEIGRECRPVSGLIITASAIGPAVAGAGAGAFFTSTTGIVVLAAVGVASTIVVRDLTSSSQ
jgi:hypothetical protein